MSCLDRARGTGPVALAVSLCLLGFPRSGAYAQDAAPSPTLPREAPGSFKPDPATKNEAQPDVWIFSGALQSSHETFSGTLIAGTGEAEFEMKLSNGATCDGEDLSGDIGLVRLKEITCSDQRVMKALFVPQGGKELKVFGHVGDERFTTSAHLLGAEPPPEKGQTAEPTVPALRGAPGMPSAPQEK